MTLPELAPDECIQVVMMGAFYNAHFKPLLEQQDFRLGKIGPADDGDPDEIATYVIALGESRARALKTVTAKDIDPTRCDPATDYHAMPHVGCIMR